MRKLTVSELILDYDLYPRHQIDSQHASHIAEAIRAGSKMPPVVIDKVSKKVVDGFHRVTAHKRLHGPNAEVEVLEKSYKHEGALFRDAIKYNANHGRMLTTYDRTRCILFAKNLNITMEQIANDLQMTIGAVGKLTKSRVGKLQIIGKSGKTDNVVTPLKRTISHKAGECLTKEQSDVNQKLSGMSQLFYVNQLIMLVESSLIDTENRNLMEGLSALGKLLQPMVQEECAAAAQ